MRYNMKSLTGLAQVNLVLILACRVIGLCGDLLDILASSKADTEVVDRKGTLN